MFLNNEKYILDSLLSYEKYENMSFFSIPFAKENFFFLKSFNFTARQKIIVNLLADLILSRCIFQKHKQRN